MTIRELHAADRHAVEEMLRASRAFSDEEIRVALEVFDSGLAGGEDGDYAHFGAETSGALKGYICVGRTPMTQSTWHLYWICVHPSAQRTGMGRALQEHCERHIRARGGERIALETSDRPDYAPTRRFYRELGYQEAGRIPDYYRRGDDCVFYCKSLVG